MGLTKRVCIISAHGYVEAVPVLGKSDTGGQVIFVLELSKRIAKLGYKVDIYTRQFEDFPQYEPVNEDITIIRIPCGGKKFVPKEYIVKIYPEFIKNMIDYIKEKGLKYEYINSHYWDGGFIGMHVSKQLGIPHIYTTHSLGLWKRKQMDGDPEILEKKYNFRQRIATEQEIFNTCDGAIATTRLHKKIFMEELNVPEKKIGVIPPGFSAQRFRPPKDEKERERTRKQLKLPKRYIFSLGRMARNKGYDLLLKAIAYTFKSVDDVVLLLSAGCEHPTKQEIKMKEELMDLARSLDILDRIVFVDYVPDEVLVEYYQCADVFALSARYEPFGIVAVEAMACGVPIVITSSGGLAQELQYGVNALFADPFKPQEFGAEISKLLLDKKLHQYIRKNAIKIAFENFTWEKIAERTLKFFKKCSRNVK